MELCKDEMKRGYIWFFTAGAFAVILSITLYSLDGVISNYHEGSYEHTADYMGELRKAQTNLGTKNLDERLLKK